MEKIKQQIEQIRNIGIIAHIDAGKTTVTERMLFYSGKTHRIGEVDEGTTITDFLEQEKERGITIESAVVSLLWKDNNINIIDTPGHVDFTGEVERSLRVLDGAVVIFSAVEGVESQSETVWHQADHYNVPRIVFINKMDRVGADFFSVINEMKDKFPQQQLILNIPVVVEDQFTGIIDLLTQQYQVWNSSDEGMTVSSDKIPSDYQNLALKYHESLMETLSDYDDKIAESYLEGKNINIENIKNTIRKLTIDNKIVPVLSGSAKKNIGVQPVMDSIADYLPSPNDFPEIKAINPEDNSICRIKTSPESPFLALVFKVVSDIHVGKLQYMRVYSGSIRNKVQVLNSSTGKKEIIQKIYAIYADKRVEVNFAKMGDIVEITGPKIASTGHSLTNYKEKYYLEKPVFPVPVVSLAIEPKSSSHLDKLYECLELLKQEDPTFKYSEDKETGQLIISGMGELYLEVLVERLKRNFGVPVNKGTPRVAYRESISSENVTSFEFSKIIGGKKYWAVVKIKVKPGSGLFCQFDIEKNLFSSFNKEIKVMLKNFEDSFKSTYIPGPLAGFPLMAISAQVTDLKINDDQIAEAVLDSALEIAFEKACQKADPVLLEPVMKMELFTPDEYLGEVMKSLNSLLAKVTSIEDRKTHKLIYSEAALSKTFGYATALRGLTKGKAMYTMQFSRYERLSPDEQQEVLKKFRGF